MGRIYRLNKAVLRVRPEKLLASITSNTLDAEKNALLDRFGKIVVTFEQFRKAGNFFIVIADKFYDRLQDSLKKYMKLTKAKIEKTDYRAYLDFDNSHEAEIRFPQDKGRIIITKRKLESNVSEEEFTLFRVRNNIPLQGIDYDNDMLLNVSEDYVSYDKGCFVGQEIIARVHYKSKPPKKLAAAEDEENMTSTVRDPDTGKKKGFAFTLNK